MRHVVHGLLLAAVAAPLAQAEVRASEPRRVPAPRLSAIYRVSLAPRVRYDRIGFQPLPKPATGSDTAAARASNWTKLGEGAVPAGEPGLALAFPSRWLDGFRHVAGFTLTTPTVDEVESDFAEATPAAAAVRTELALTTTTFFTDLEYVQPLLGPLAWTAAAGLELHRAHLDLTAVRIDTDDSVGTLASADADLDLLLLRIGPGLTASFGPVTLTVAAALSIKLLATQDEVVARASDFEAAPLSGDADADLARSLGLEGAPVGGTLLLGAGARL